MKSKINIYGILAYPAKHSLSPIIHNSWFEKLWINASYEIFEIGPENLENFIKTVRSEKISGLSVSMPYKQEVIKYLDDTDEISKKLKSVNTIYWSNDKLIWTNTDIYWILDPIKALIEEEISNPSVAILWAWGAASAAIYAMKKISNNITIFNRTTEKAKNLSEVFWILHSKLDDFISRDFDIILQMTSVGMWESKDIIIPNIEFNSNQIVFESIYHPIETKFIKRAIKSWAKIVTWENMLLYQAIKQFEIWTGEIAPVDVMRNALKNALKA